MVKTREVTAEVPSFFPKRHKMVFVKFGSFIGDLGLYIKYIIFRRKKCSESISFIAKRKYSFHNEKLLYIHPARARRKIMSCFLLTEESDTMCPSSGCAMAAIR